MARFGNCQHKRVNNPMISGFEKMCAALVAARIADGLYHV